MRRNQENISGNMTKQDSVTLPKDHTNSPAMESSSQGLLLLWEGGMHHLKGLSHAWDKRIQMTGFLSPRTFCGWEIAFGRGTGAVLGSVGKVCSSIPEVRQPWCF